MSNEIIQNQKVRDKLHKEWIKAGKTPDSPLHKKYKKIRNQVLSMSRKAKRDMIQKNCDDTKGDSGKMLKVINSQIKTKSKTETTPVFVKVVAAVGNTIKITNKKKIADEMNRQFAEMGANLASKLPTTNANFNDYLPSPNPNHERFILHSVPESKVGKLIEELDEGKGVGVHKIPPKLIK